MVTIEPKNFAGAVVGAVTGFFFGGPVGAAAGALLGYYGQKKIETSLVPHWVRQADGTVRPGDYVAFAFPAPAGWDDATVAKYKLSLAALGFNSNLQHPSGITAPAPGPGGVGFQGRFVGHAPRNVCADLPPGTPCVVLIVHPRSHL